MAHSTQRSRRKTRRATSQDSAAPDRRQALIEAAMKVVAERGFRGFTYRAVALEAGVTHGLVQHHFGTLEALLEEALETSLERDRLQAPPDTSHAVDEIVELLPGHIAATRAQQTFQYTLLVESLRHPDLAPHLRRIYGDYVAAMQQRLERAGLPQDPALARIVFAAVDGLVLQRLFCADEDEMTASLNWLQEMLSALSDSAVRSPGAST